MKWVDTMKVEDLIPGEVKFQQLSLETGKYEDIIFEEIEKLNMRKEDEDFVGKVLAQQKLKDELVTLLKKSCKALKEHGIKMFASNKLWLTSGALKEHLGLSDAKFNNVLEYGEREKVLKKVKKLSKVYIVLLNDLNADKEEELIKKNDLKKDLEEVCKLLRIYGTQYKSKECSLTLGALQSLTDLSKE